MPSPTERRATVHQTPAVRKILTSAFRLLTDADFPHRMTEDTVRNGIARLLEMRASTKSLWLERPRGPRPCDGRGQVVGASVLGV